VEPTPLIDIANLHRLNKSPRAISDFFRSGGYTKARDYLIRAGVPDDQIVVRGTAHRSIPGVALVHSLVAMEYTRWVEYDIFCGIFLQHYKLHVGMVNNAVAEKAERGTPHGGLNG
jgi:hypothetical protein